MALVGLVRVSTKKQETSRQHDALDSICVKVFEEKVSGKLDVDSRPGLREAIEYMRDGDMLTVQEVDRLGRNLLEGLIVLTDLFERGIAVKVLEADRGRRAHRAVADPRPGARIGRGSPSRHRPQDEERAGGSAEARQGRWAAAGNRRRQARSYPRPSREARVHPRDRSSHWYLCGSRARGGGRA